MDFIDDDIDYLWGVAHDHIYNPKGIEKIIGILEESKCSYTQVRFKTVNFYGGFDRRMTGYEESLIFPLIHRVYPGTRWRSHRPLKLVHEQTPLPSKILGPQHGVKVFHYGYVFPDHVSQKTKYYREWVARPGGAPGQTRKMRRKLSNLSFEQARKESNVIENYFENVYLPWVKGNKKQREEIEAKYRGVQVLRWQYRQKIGEADCYTAKFTGKHPKIIQDNMDKLMKKFNEQLEKYIPVRKGRRSRKGHLLK